MTEHSRQEAQQDDMRQDETQAATTDPGSSPSLRSIAPALTILAHPDSERIGERRILPLLALGREARLARLEPTFGRPGAPEVRERPLDERSVSRSPIFLRGVVSENRSESFSIRIDVGSTRTRLSVDGAPIEGGCLIDAAALDRGCVLQVGRRIVMLLHCVALPVPEDVPRFGLVGESDGIVHLRSELERIAPLDVPILLRGESGVGKELAARALHEGSPRSAGPFVAVNMATLSPSLAAAELFGAVRGAYTGADRAKKGFFEAAEGGTLFLDEIGEAPVEVQAMLLRALESGEVLPVGGIQSRSVDVRVVAATDARLEQAMIDGAFRTPLYHRLAGYSVRLPPLRERLDDLGRLLRFFLAEELRTLQSAPTDGSILFPPVEIVVKLARYHWPGNVRELRNVARRLAILGPESDLPRLLECLEGLAMEEPPAASVAAPTMPAFPPAQTAEAKALAPAMRRAADLSDEEIQDALREHRWDVLNTAKSLRVSRSALYRRMEKSDIGRKAAHLDEAEIEEASRRCGGDVEAMVEMLQVSERALRRRLASSGD